MQNLKPLLMLLLLCSVLFGSVEAQEQRRYTPQLMRVLVSDNSPHIFVDENSDYITILGAITEATALSFERHVNDSSRIKTLFIDSIGGDMIAAVRIAEILRSRKMTLVVDGRCLSACAQVIFVAAEKKVVMEGSLVGIHGIRILDSKGIELSLVELKSEVGERHQVDQPTWEHARRMLEKIKMFYESSNISTTLIDAFQTFEARRERFLSQRKHDYALEPCRSIRFWALNKEQLEQFGGRIEKFWFPNDMANRSQVLMDLGLAPNSVYFGDEAGLSVLCR